MCGNVNTVLARQYIIKSGMLQDCTEMLKLVQLVKLTFARYQFLFVTNMTFLQAHNRTAACPSLNLQYLKSK